jgi:hypothetical protein
MKRILLLTFAVTMLLVSYAPRDAFACKVCGVVQAYCTGTNSYYDKPVCNYEYRNGSVKCNISLHTGTDGCWGDCVEDGNACTEGRGPMITPNGAELATWLPDAPSANGRSCGTRSTD